MAIDTRTERASVALIITPNSDKDEPWRRTVTGIYSFGEDVPPEPPPASEAKSTRMAIALSIGIGM